MPIITVFIFIVGLFFLLRLRAFFLFHPLRTLRLWWSAQKAGKREAVGTLSLALAGTLGVGNVTGVAFCLLRGGAGSAFWMLLSAVFASALKFAESTVTLLDREKHRRKIGGMPYVIQNSWRFGGVTAMLYALLCLCTSLTMGAALQMRAITETASALFDFPILPLSIFSTLFAFFLMRDGKEKIVRASEILVPLATIVYISLCLTVIIRHRSALPSVFSDILKDAFSLTSATYGVGGFSILCHIGKSAYAGISAGLLSNESGAGTSTLAHGGNLSATPSAEGVLGIFEIVVDTVLLCTLTAVTLLCGGFLSSSSTAMDLIVRTFEGSMSGAFRLPFFLSVFIFALATVICWFSYGEICRNYLFAEKGRTIFFLIYLCALFFGGFLPTEVCIPVSDTFLALLSFLTLFTLLKNHRAVIAEAKNSGYMRRKNIEKTLDK